MAGRNKPFELNPTQGSIPRSMLSWGEITRGIDRSKRSKASKASRRRGAHNTRGGQTFQEISEPVLTMGTAAAAAAPAGLLGMGVGALDAIRGGEDPMGEAARTSREIQEQLTYAPRTKRGQENLIGIADTLGGLMQPIEDFSRYLGDSAQDAGAGPGLSTAAYMAPELAMTAMGLPASLRQGRKFSKALDAIPEVNPMAGPGRRQAGMLGGSGAKKLDPETKRLATDLKEAGATPEQIWKATGDRTGQPSFFDEDGNFKWEFDDSLSGYAPDAEDWGKISDNYVHPELYANYPDIADYRYAEPRNASYRGAFTEGKNPSIEVKSTLEPWEKRSTMLHELGHGIQYKDNLPVGGSPALLKQRASGLEMSNARNLEQQQELQANLVKAQGRKLGDGWIMDAEDEAGNLRHQRRIQGKLDTLRGQHATAQEKIDMDPLEGYYAIQGERDARAIQARRDLSMDDRLSRPFWMDYDTKSGYVDPIMRYRGKPIL